ncbi:MAG: hypothetical protein RLZZ234_783 [Candidatus Parcubacteria bacterium]|jgi:hypothetical protein
MDIQTNTPDTAPKTPVVPQTTAVQKQVTEVRAVPSPVKQQPKKPLLPKLGWRSVAALVVLLLVVILATLTYISRDTLPGEPLFNLKVNVLERGFAMTRLTKSAQASYGVTRMEKRLNELLVLQRDSASSTEETLRTIAGLSNEHAQGALAALTDSLLTPEARINALARVTTASKAEETLAQEFPEFAPVKDDFETLRQSLSDALKVSVESYASTTPIEEVKLFVAEHVQNVSRALPSVAQGSDAQRIAIRRVEIAQESIEKNELAVALLSLIKAEEAIAVDGYVWGSERGEEELSGEAPVTEGQ